MMRNASWHGLGLGLQNNQKPECPLCRAPVGTADPMCIFNGDF